MAPRGTLPLRCTHGRRTEATPFCRGFILMTHIRARRGLLLALLLVAGTVTAIAPASAGVGADGASVTTAAPGGPQQIVKSGLILRTIGGCGQVALIVVASPTDATLLSRLPLNIYVSEPSRSLPRTYATTLSNANLTTSFTSPGLMATAPSGRGPGLTVSLEWGASTETVVTEPYVDNCAGLFIPVVPKRLLDTRTGLGTASGTKTAVAANSFIVVDPVGVGAAPVSGATAVVLNVTATEPATAGYLTVYPCGQEPPNTSNLNFAAGQTVPNLVVVDLVGFPSTGTVCIFSSAMTHVLADITGYYLTNGLGSGARMTALGSPQRVLDTRSGDKIAGGAVRHVQMAGQAGIPATGVTGVAMNITAVDAAGPGYLTVFPCDSPQPNSSNVNYIASRAVPNAAIVGLGAEGTMCVFTSATANVLIDVVGYASIAGGTYLPSAPTRLWDNRINVFAGDSAPRKLGPGLFFKFTAPYPAGTILALNVTVIDADLAGYATVYPCDQGVPGASNLNYQAGEAIANTVLVKTDATGAFCLFTTARINFIYDINGYSLPPTA